MKKRIFLAILLFCFAVTLASCCPKKAKIDHSDLNVINGLREDNPFYEVYRQAIESHGQWSLITKSATYYMASRPEKNSVSIAKEWDGRFVSVSYNFDRKDYIIELNNASTGERYDQAVITEEQAIGICRNFIAIIKEELKNYRRKET